jgi:sialate O-acetylesterase
VLATATRVLLLLLTLLAPARAWAAPAAVSVTSPALQDHMVVQRDMPVPIWGTGSPVGGDVVVTFNGQTKPTTVAADGTWRIDLDAMTAGGPHQLQIVGSNTIVIDDVLIGEVWLASGQSNMAAEPIQPSVRVDYPLVRTLRHHDWEEYPLETAWFLGKHLFDTLGVPIGIINLAVSGSQIRDWLPPDAAQDLSPEVLLEIASEMSRWHDAHIAPILPYAIRGIFWWQGEQDMSRTRLPIYQEQLVALIRGWRRAFEDEDMPFVFVQLPGGRGPSPDRTPSALPASPPRPKFKTLMYAEYLDTLLTEPFTGMVVTKDLGNGLHPYDREPHAERMVRWARHLTYGETLMYSGPIVESATREGTRVRIRFRAGTADGLHGLPPHPAQGFALSQDGEGFEWAQVQIEGTEVVVWNDAMPTPTRVRYAWEQRSRWANLVNGEDMAASPFDLPVAD